MLKIAPAVLALALVSQEIEVLIQEGDTLPGGGLVLAVFNSAIADTGDWVASIYLNDWPPFAGSVLIRNGEPVFMQGTALHAPDGTTATGAGVPDITRDGRALVWNSFQPAGGPGSLKHGIWLDQSFLAVTGDPVVSPTLPATTEYGSMVYARADSKGDTLLQCDFTEPSLGPLHTLAILRRDPLSGLTVTDVVLEVGDVLPGLPSPVLGFRPDALNDSGDRLYSVDYEDPAIFFEGALFLNDQLLAYRGGPAPLPGAVWADVTSNFSADMNEHGSIAYSGILRDFPLALLVKNEQKFVAAYDPLPDIAPYPLEVIGSSGYSPIRIADTDQIAWAGGWWEPSESGGAKSESGIFLDKSLLVRSGVSQVQGELIESLSYFHMSRGGRFLSFVAELESGSSGVFSIDLLSTAEPVVGCLGLNQANLVAAGGGPVAGTTMTLELDKAQSLQSAGLLGLSTSPASDPCGVLLPGGSELLLGLPILVLDAGVWSGSPLSIDLAIPASLAFVGTVVHAQGAFINPAPGAAEPVRLSNGLALRIGAN